MKPSADIPSIDFDPSAPGGLLWDKEPRQRFRCVWILGRTRHFRLTSLKPDSTPARSCAKHSLGICRYRSNSGPLGSAGRRCGDLQGDEGLHPDGLGQRNQAKGLQGALTGQTHEVLGA